MRKKGLFGGDKYDDQQTPKTDSPATPAPAPAEEPAPAAA